jgi:hypothetical protein
MLILRQSTSIDVRLGPFVDVGDGFTPETGVTIAASDEAEVLKADGAATEAMTGALVAVTGCDGYYDYTVATGDVDTVGEIVFVMQDDSVYLPVRREGYVVEEAIYDALYASGSAAPATAAALATVDTVVDAIKVITDALGVVAAARLALTGAGMLPGTVDDTVFTPTTTEFEADDITEATASHYNGRNVLWTSGVLLDQMTDITAYALTGGRGHFTVTAMTEEPGNNDTFVIV